MKKLIFISILLFIPLITIAQITLKFKNKEWQEIKPPIIQFEVSGEKRYFMVDSGSDISILNTIEAKKLHDDYKIGNVKCDISTVNGSMEQVSMFYYLKILNIKQRFYTRDLSYINNIYDDENIKLFGILGADWLQNRKAVIDYNKRIIILNN